MRCEDVRQELAGEMPDAVRDDIAEHLRECPACRQVQAIYGLMDEALQATPMWEPPFGFEARVAARGAQEVRGEAFYSRWSWKDGIRAALSGMAIAAAAYLGADAFDLDPLRTMATAPTPAVMWTWVILAYGVAYWFASEHSVTS